MADLLLMEPDQDRIIERISSRRAIMERQIKADQIKSDLCNCIGGEIRADPELEENFATIAETMPKMASFISRMRYVQRGIWCGRCNDIMNVAAPDGTVLHAQTVVAPTTASANTTAAPQTTLSPIVEDERESENNDAVDRLEENLDAIRTAMNDMNQTYVARYKELFSSLNENAKILAFLREEQLTNEF